MNCQAQASAISDHEEVEITTAAIRTYGRLLRSLGRAITTHSAGDGGLICEDRAVPARPVMWRISAEGVVLPDRRYSFAQKSFSATVLPQSLGLMSAASAS